MWTVVKLVGRRTKEKVPRARRTSLSDVSAGYSTEPWIKVVSRDCMRTFQFWVIASSRNTSRRYVDCLLSNIIMLPRPVAIARCNRYFYAQSECIIFRFLFCFTRRYSFTLFCELWYHAIHFISVAEIVEGVRRGGGSPLRPVIDDASVEEEVNTIGKCILNVFAYSRYIYT